MSSEHWGLADSHEEAEPMALAASGLGRRFGRRWAVARLDLRLPAGQALLLAGGNGSGKTTLLRMIAGLWRPSRGRLRIHGEDLSGKPRAWRRQVSLVAHEAYLYPGLTARETVGLWARLLGRPATDADLHRLLAEVGLQQVAERCVSEFSAGMRKRLTLVRIRLEDCRILLLDEPFAALDSAGQRLMRQWIEVALAAGKSVVIASHALPLCTPFCHRAMLLWRGQVAWEGPASEASHALLAVEREREQMA